MESKWSAFVVPAHLQSSSEFFVWDVQVALRLHDARVAKHQLNDPVPVSRASTMPPRMPLPLARGACHANVNGFDVHAGIVGRASERERLERLFRYTRRPPVADARFRVDAKGTSGSFCRIRGRTAPAREVDRHPGNRLRSRRDRRRKRIRSRTSRLCRIRFWSSSTGRIAVDRLDFSRPAQGRLRSDFRSIPCAEVFLAADAPRTYCDRARESRVV